MDNKQEFSIQDYNEYVKKLKVGCPVHKINFTTEHPNALAGMYLLTLKDPISYINEIVDLEDVNDDTLLFFEPRHVVECCQLIYGCLSVLNDMHLLKYGINFCIYHIIENLLTRPIFYKDLLNAVSVKWLFEYDSENAKIVDKIFSHIMKNIWFISYNDIDNIAYQAIEDFKKNSDKNE